MDILTRIVEHKHEEVAQARKHVPENRLWEMAEQGQGERRGFFNRLEKPGPSGTNIIAEIKRASPSKGPICPDLDPGAYASEYEKGGAAALSVLTDKDFFQGSFDDLKAARSAVSLPVLRKDFIILPYQIYESAVLGADAILLIVRILDLEQLQDYLDLAASLNLDVLTEVHSAAELETSIRAGARLVGINNRNLSSFETNIQRAASLAALFGPDQIPVAESGIKNRDDIEALKDAGFHNFLIGESIVRAPDPAGFIRSLL
jgi:indole-3-glycerol phosphate synthase